MARWYRLICTLLIFGLFTINIVKGQVPPARQYLDYELAHDSVHNAFFERLFSKMHQRDNTSEILFDLNAENFDTVANANETSSNEITEIEQEQLLSDSLNPLLFNDLVADRLACIENQIPLKANDVTSRFSDFFTRRRRDYTLKMLNRASCYFPIFEQILSKHGVPPEIKYLSIVESGLEPQAISRAGAAGLWQFMPFTGRAFGLKQDYYIDQRMDPILSTEAAALYLKQLYSMFNDWELALASYNCGSGAVRRSIRRSGNRQGFWNIYNFLPRETRSYVPQFVAVTYAMNYSREHMMQADSAWTPFVFDTITLPKQYVNLEVLAINIGVSLEELQHLNPAIRRNVVPEYLYPYQLRIPEGTRGMVYAILPAILDSLKTAHENDKLQGKKELAQVNNEAHKTFHTVKSGESLGAIASKYNVSTDQLKRWNGIQSNLIHPGQKLKVYSRAQLKPSAKYNAYAKQQRNGTKFHVVQQGDTLWTISKKYSGISVDDIKRMNKLDGDDIKPGMRLKIVL